MNFDWDNIPIPDYEDPVQTKIRLDAIHRKILEDKGIVTKPEKNSPGFRPSPGQAREVSVMAALGLDPSDIALVLNIEEKMLKTYYAKELRVSHNIANAMVARVALQMAMSGRFPDMTKFWLKSRAKWKETHAIELTDPNKEKDGLDTPKDRLRRMITAQSATKQTPEPSSE